MGWKNYLLILGLLLFPTLFAWTQTGNFQFVENKGQWDSKILYQSDVPAGAFYLHNNGFTVLQHNVYDLTRLQERMHMPGETAHGVGRDPLKPIQLVEPPKSSINEVITLHSHAYKVSFLGANAAIPVRAEKKMQEYSNYFMGNDPSKWASNVSQFGAVTYANVYPNIDVRYYAENGRLKYDFVVHPGGRVSDIQMEYAGVTKLSVKKRELIIGTSVGEIKELYPYSYQFIPGVGKKEVTCDYEIVQDSVVRFKIKPYDATQTLIIDPTLIFSTFTGGSNNYGFTATPGPDGGLFAGCLIFAAGFPVTPGAFQKDFGGGNAGSNLPTDIGIMKFNPTGTARMYATYLGGNGNDFPHSLFADPQGNLVVLGRSYSSDYPTTVAQVGTGGGADIVVTKLNATGSALIGSLKIGGSGADGVNISDNFVTLNHVPQSLSQNYGDESRSEVVLDAGGNIYVAANSNSSNFPTTAGAFQTTRSGLQDGVVLKINPNCNAVIWSSYLGGTGDDGAYVLEINPATQNIFVAGGTASSNFPGISGGVLQGTFNGGLSDGYVAEIANNGSAIIRSTYLGTTALDIIYGIKFDRLGFPYVMGITRGTWPVVNATYSNANSKQFVAKLQPNLSAFVYSTVFGSGAPKPNMSPVAFLVDRCENVYISGWGGWIDNRPDPYDMAGVAGMPTTTDAIKKTTDNKDFYFIVIQKNASALLYGSFFGQDGGEGEHVDGGTSRFDAQGVIYQAICANCGGGVNFPTTPGVVAPVNTSGGCNLAAVKISFNFAGVASGPKAFINGVQDTVGCLPLTINFRDTVKNAKSYEWDFGDGSGTIRTTNTDISHTFTATGTYTIRLIAVDSNTCNIRDTAFIHVRVRDDKANLNFTNTKLPPCESITYRFDNLSTAPPGKPFTGQGFVWDFGDGTRISSGTGSVTHAFPSAGTYKVKLILTDTNYCNAPDSMSVDLRIASNVDAQFQTNLNGCVPYNAQFNNTSLAGTSFFWDFGDGTTSTEISPTHLYANIGTYTVKMYATDPNTCNQVDSLIVTLTVNPIPTANFSYTPVTPVLNTPTIFTNLSQNAVRYKWLFGDGDSTIKNTADTTLHQYNVSGTYNACLIAYNQFGCTDTICQPIQALVKPLLDVPNAFTPNRFGNNSVIGVRGFGIVKMKFTIYNRWGQVVFSTTDRKIGWDGTFNGKPQPMDVYAYTLEAEFSDGTKARKTGDITLIR